MKQNEQPLPDNQGSPSKQIKPKRLLVYENMAPLPRIIEDFNKIIELANNIADQYEELNIGKFSQDVYKNVIENNLLNVRETYLRMTKSEISRLNINNPTIKSTMLTGIDETLDPLKNALTLLKKHSSGIGGVGYYTLTSQYNKVSFIDRRFVLSDNDIEKLKDEYCRTYLENKKQEEAFNGLETFIKAYNEFIEVISKNNEPFANQLKNSISDMDKFTWCSDGKVSIYRPNLDQFLYTP